MPTPFFAGTNSPFCRPLTADADCASHRDKNRVCLTSKYAVDAPPTWLPALGDYLLFLSKSDRSHKVSQGNIVATAEPFAPNMPFSYFGEPFPTAASSHDPSPRVFSTAQVAQARNTSTTTDQSPQLESPGSDAIQKTWNEDTVALEWNPPIMPDQVNCFGLEPHVSLESWTNLASTTGAAFKGAG